MNKNYKKYIIGITAVCGILITGIVFSANVKTNAIKPVAQQAVSDEQQAILAVRGAKISVVDIVGVTASDKLNKSGSDSAAISVNPVSTVYGTGFILEADGLIVSNNHVVADSNMNYTVILADGTQYPAKILNQDKFDDVAILKIDAQNLVPAKLGDSSKIETGQTVFAIGNSMGQYQYTVTRGVVSALGRSVSVSTDSNGQVDTRLHNLIQTDASINPGNSGGPLINLAGEVVGMNTLIDTSGESLSFAIPINVIKDAEQQIKTFGKVSRPYLGIQFLNIDPAIQAAKSLSVSSGCLVVSVLANTPAKTAGILAGDIILSVNGVTLNPNSALDDVVQTFPAGSQVNLKVLRNGQTLDIPVILGQLQ